MKVAKRQGPPPYRLDAAHECSRQHQGKKAAARRMLAEVYGWFTEGV